MHFLNTHKLVPLSRDHQVIVAQLIPAEAREHIDPTPPGANRHTLESIEPGESGTGVQFPALLVQELLRADAGAPSAVPEGDAAVGGAQIGALDCLVYLLAGSSRAECVNACVDLSCRCLVGAQGRHGQGCQQKQSAQLGLVHDQQICKWIIQRDIKINQNSYTELSLSQGLQVNQQNSFGLVFYSFQLLFFFFSVILIFLGVGISGKHFGGVSWGSKKFILVLSHRKPIYFYSIVLFRLVKFNLCSFQNYALFLMSRPLPQLQNFDNQQLALWFSTTFLKYSLNSSLFRFYLFLVVVFQGSCLVLKQIIVCFFNYAKSIVLDFVSNDCWYFSKLEVCQYLLLKIF